MVGTERVLTAGAIKEHAAELGFDLCGIAAAVPFPELRGLKSWLGRGYAGEMRYLARTAERRMDPLKVLPGARSVIVTGTVYNVDRPYSVTVADDRRALVSRYGWGDDYHAVLSGRLDALLSWMRVHHETPFEARACVDTGPVQEKIFAQHAGLGWIGKNTCVINCRLGSWIFLALIVCSLDLEPDAVTLDRCSSCTRCIEACPTQALVEPRVLDATRCLSYLTIELRGSIPAALRPLLGNHVFGCDVCQDVCPWNASAARSVAPEWQPRPGLDHPSLADLWRRGDAELAAMVEGTPLTRATLAGLRRNVAVAMGNCGDPAAQAALAAPGVPAAADDSPSRNDPLVREHLAWAAAAHRTKGIR